LYFAGGELSLMVIDGSVVKSSRWAAVGDKLWLGDISPNCEGRRVQDAKITGIPEPGYKLAIQLARCKAKNKLSPETLAKRRTQIRN